MDPASDAVVVTVKGLNVDQAVVDRLAREINGRLILAGFDRDKDGARRVELQVVVTAFSPGDATLRLMVGFGGGIAESCGLAGLW